MVITRYQLYAEDGRELDSLMNSNGEARNRVRIHEERGERTALEEQYFEKLDSSIIYEIPWV